MSVKWKRYTISVTNQIETDLDAAKKEYFYNNTKSEMLRQLIVLGLDTLMADKKEN
jgi:hypothetical protein